MECGLADFLRKASLFDLSDQNILEVGCGWGDWLFLSLGWGARPEGLFGTDLLPERVEVARQRLPKSEIVLDRAEKLPWRVYGFDLVFQFNLFSSVTSPQARLEAAGEIWRVLKPGGISFPLIILSPVRPIRARLESDYGKWRGCFPKRSFIAAGWDCSRLLHAGWFPFLVHWRIFWKKSRILSGHYLAWSIKK